MEPETITRLRGHKLAISSRRAHFPSLREMKLIRARTMKPFSARQLDENDRNDGNWINELLRDRAAGSKRHKSQILPEIRV